MLAEMIHVSRRTLSLALHLAAGVGLAADRPWIPRRPVKRRPARGPLAIHAGVALDLFSDGVLIGTGSDPALISAYFEA